MDNESLTIRIVTAVSVAFLTDCFIVLYSQMCRTRFGFEHPAGELRHCVCLLLNYRPLLFTLPVMAAVLGRTAIRLKKPLLGEATISATYILSLLCFFIYLYAWTRQSVPFISTSNY